jgi:CO/xanthine dehydrogenase FAD-binding subunit
MGISRSFSVVYTRYADDLTFSGANISLKTVEIITRIIKEEGFAVNEAKTRLCRGKGKRIVTGISVQGEFPQLPAAYKRRVRQEAYYVTKYGVASHVAKLRIRRAFYLDSLLGKLMFWKWVEPDNQFVNRILPQIESLRRA